MKNLTTKVLVLLLTLCITVISVPTENAHAATIGDGNSNVIIGEGNTIKHLAVVNSHLYFPGNIERINRQDVYLYTNVDAYDWADSVQNSFTENAFELALSTYWGIPTWQIGAAAGIAFLINSQIKTIEANEIKAVAKQTAVGGVHIIYYSDTNYINNTTVNTYEISAWTPSQTIPITVSGYTYDSSYYN